MKLQTTQKGITLLEVLVGFVIFTTSLVAVLDYVSGQVFHYYRSASHLGQVQVIYDWVALARADETQQVYLSSARDETEIITISASIMETVEVRGEEILLNRYSYQADGSDATSAWKIIRIN